ncbi:MAG: Mitochondrial distribution and morphology protein 12 [Bathelium mastoideum]|nr:MAG: Mitochondrial distribution and morphology protein 12 [Bathelium mastoideum]
MSVDIHWDTIANGTDGEELAEQVRAFIHERFQQVNLPRFIRSVKVHSFDFGNVPPEVELKDICDPLPDFYEENEDDEASEHDETKAGNEERLEHDDNSNVKRDEHAQSTSVQVEDHLPRQNRLERNDDPSTSRVNRPGLINTRYPGLKSSLESPGHLGTPSPITGAVSTPGIPGGTANMNYFHLPLGGGLSGAATPLAAFGGGQFHHGWNENHGFPGFPGHVLPPQLSHSASVSSIATPASIGDPSSRPVSQQHQQPFSPTFDEQLEQNLTQELPPTTRLYEKSENDLQVVSHVRYAGNIRLSLTAEILLDYPMPSFVGIPLKLNITGLTFDGVAILAYIKNRCHFCFLSPGDAEMLLGNEGKEQSTEGKDGHEWNLGLLEEIKVESEIGERGDGKQSLKNVGKVEKFVLEQVRRIFEDEFVYPSFWTFLV